MYCLLIRLRKSLEGRECALNLLGFYAVRNSRITGATEVVAGYDEYFVLLCSLAEFRRVTGGRLEEEIECSVRANRLKPVACKLFDKKLSVSVIY